MAITTKTQSGLVDSQVAATQASSSGLIDFSVGSVLLAVFQGIAALGTWLQAIVLQLSLKTRLATSTGADADSFVNDFGMERLGAIFASGQVTFSRFSTTSQALVQIGDTVESADGTQQFLVTLDTTNVNYSAALGGYVMAIGIASINAPVSAVTSGAAGNVAAGVISVITGSIPGVDTVTNAAALTNGADAESDPAVRTRFPLYINSRSQGTPAAVDYAVDSVQQNLDFKLVENYAYNGAWDPGYSYVVVDDGTGSPPSSLLTAVQAAINAARPLCGQFGVFPPVLVDITVNMTITGGSTSAVQADLQAYINGVGLGGTCEYSQLFQTAGAVAGVTNVTGVTLNGGTNDVVCTSQQRPIVLAVNVSQS